MEIYAIAMRNVKMEESARNPMPTTLTNTAIVHKDLSAFGAIVTVLCSARMVATANIMKRQCLVNLIKIEILMITSVSALDSLKAQIVRCHT